MPRPTIWQRLPFRLAATILLLSAATLVIVTEVRRHAVERLLLAQAEIQAELSTAAVIDGLDAVTSAAERMARLLARDLAGGTLTAAEAQARARNVLLDSPNFHACTLALGADGPAVEVARVDSPERFRVRDLAGAGGPRWPPPWYEEVVSRGQLSWSDPFFDLDGSGRAAVRVVVPILRDPEADREPIGVVAITLDLEWLRRLANVQEFSDTAFTIVFSRSGRVILHPRPTYVVAETIETLAEKTGAPELLAIRRNILVRRQGILEYTETAPTRRVHVHYKPARYAGWGVIVGFEQAEFLRTVRAYRALTYGSLGLLLVLLAAIVIIATQRALRPLGQLAQAADEIGRRNLDCEIPPPRRVDEVGHLAHSFLAMRDALKGQHLERRWAAQSMEHQLRYHQLIVDSMHEPVFVLTKALHVSRVNPAAVRATGLSEPALLKAPITRFVELVADPGHTSEVLTAALRDGRELTGLPAVIRCADHTTVTLHLNLVPIRDHGRIVGGVVTFPPGPAAHA